MRITLSISNESMLIGNDVPSFMGKTNENENRSKIYVGVDNKEEAKKLFDGLSVGAQVEAQPDDSTDETYFAMFRDKYSIEWIIENVTK